MTHQTVRAQDPELVPTASGATQEPDSGCPVEVALSAISGRWTTLILRELFYGPLSYSAIRFRLPQLSDKVLTDRLRSLHQLGLVARETSRGFPNSVSYRLTKKGELVRPLLVELYRTGEELLRIDR